MYLLFGAFLGHSSFPTLLLKSVGILGTFCLKTQPRQTATLIKPNIPVLTVFLGASCTNGHFGWRSRLFVGGPADINSKNLRYLK
jgi:hypothetical protein